MTQGNDDELPRVFLSYSRKDSQFVELLAQLLEARGFTIDWDLAAADPDNVSTGISAQDEWWNRLRDMVAAADVMVFVVSPDSAISMVCDEEIAYARAIGKRVIGIMHRSIDFAAAPPRLAAMNVKISFDEDTSGNPLQELVRALSIDVGWHRNATWFTQEALRWDAGGKEEELLLQGSDLRAAEHWMVQKPPNAPVTPSVVQEFIAASQELQLQRADLAALQRIRYQAIEHVTQEFLAEELRLRERDLSPGPGHPAVDEEERIEIEKLRNLVDTPRRWHPQPARHLGSSGASDGYTEYFKFPCCGKGVKDFLAGSDDPPSQLRTDGCREIPESLIYAKERRGNPFRSRLVADFRGEPKLLWRTRIFGDADDTFD